MHGDRALPFEIAKIAVEDENVQMRAWIARKGKYLNYSEEGLENLEDRLRNDPDPFVRACLRENPTTYDFFADWVKLFIESTHFERLALIRNPDVDSELIEKLFDHEDQELGINLKERHELVLAFLTNKKVLSRFKKSRIEPRDWIDRDAAHQVCLHYSKLWDLISRWPKDTNTQSAVYLGLWADDETKARIYKVCDEAVWRRCILMNCDPSDKKTIDLALKDADDINRDMACALANRSNAGESGL